MSSRSGRAARLGRVGAIVQMVYGLLAVVFPYPRIADRPFEAEIHCRFAATTHHLFAGAWIAPRHEHAELPRSRKHVSR